MAVFNSKLWQITPSGGWATHPYRSFQAQSPLRVTCVGSASKIIAGLLGLKGCRLPSSQSWPWDMQKSFGTFGKLVKWGITCGITFLSLGKWWFSSRRSVQPQDPHYPLGRNHHLHTMAVACFNHLSNVCCNEFHSSNLHISTSWLWFEVRILHTHKPADSCHMSLASYPD